MRNKIIIEITDRGRNIIFLIYKLIMLWIKFDLGRKFVTFSIILNRI
jgi:hypothetical protein